MGDNLETVINSCGERLNDSTADNEIYMDSLVETCQNLMGRSRDPLDLFEATELETIARSLSMDHDLSSELWTLLLRIFVCIHMDRFHSADSLICQFKRLTKRLVLPGLLKNLLLFYDGLTSAVLASQVDCREKRIRLNAAQKILRKLRSVDKDDSIMRNKAFMLDAQIHAARGQEETALLLFHKSVDLANDQGFTHEQGLAFELAGRMCQQCNNRGVEAELYMSQAKDYFGRWGAYAKVDQLELAGRHNSMGFSSQSNA
ncbi:protein kinase [Seminavis robusta]|uniref:Protein kinase n=1 Tax=Seminavis robusta TaxID=568900 RepID=A0A9N8EGV4_9STRA|nr:protein kinase [Seminavis robusta]|eukprot:Sro1109_g242320.1 protein kinase (EC 2.7.11.1) (260) ;mRNA; r:24432-25211